MSGDSLRWNHCVKVRSIFLYVALCFLFLISTHSYYSSSSLPLNLKCVSSNARCRLILSPLANSFTYNKRGEWNFYLIVSKHLWYFFVCLCLMIRLFRLSWWRDDLRPLTPKTPNPIPGGRPKHNHYCSEHRWEREKTYGFSLRLFLSSLSVVFPQMNVHDI